MIRKDLSDLTVLVTRPELQAKKLCQSIENQGGQAISFPTIEIKPISLITHQPNFDYYIFVSQHAVNYSHALIKQFSTQHKIFAVGETTASLLQQQTQQPIIYPQQEFNSEALLALPELQFIAGKKIALVCGKETKPLLTTALRERGAEISELIVYERQCPNYSKVTILKLWQDYQINVVVCTSKACLQNLILLLDSDLHFLLNRALVVVSQAMVELAQQIQKNHHVYLAKSAQDHMILQCLSEEILINE